MINCEKIPPKIKALINTNRDSTICLYTEVVAVIDRLAEFEVAGDEVVLKSWKQSKEEEIVQRRQVRARYHICLIQRLISNAARDSTCIVY
jgi:hypothetical protein